MTEQTIGGAGGTPPDRPANNEELKPALAVVLKGQANAAVQKWKDDANALVEQQLAHIADPERRAVWKAQMAALIDDLARKMFDDLKDSVVSSVEEAYEELILVEHSDIMCLDVTRAKMTSATRERLRSFTSSTGLMKGLDAAQPGAASKLAALAQQSTAVEAHRTNTLAMCNTALTQLTVTVTDANAAVQYVATLQLTEILAPLTAPLLKHRATAEQLLLQTSIVHLGQQIDTRLKASFSCTAAEQNQAITEICTPASTALVNAHLNLSGSITLVRPEVVDRFSCLSNMGLPALSMCTSMVGFYGKPWLVCIAGLEPAEIGQVLLHCQNATILTAVKKKMPAQSTALQLSKAVGILAWSGEDWTTVCAAINKLGYTEIQLPATVTAVTWIPIHQSWVPRAFCTASMETDLACLKHMKQETGATPSPSKLASYFAELSNACIAACAEWRQAGRPASLQVQVAQGVATWSIHVRNLYGKPQVFHVDSGYAKSPWVKRPN